MTTVFILTSGRPTNKAFDIKPPLSLELQYNKALLKIKDDYRVIDYQMDILLRNRYLCYCWIPKR